MTFLFGLILTCYSLGVPISLEPDVLVALHFEEVTGLKVQVNRKNLFGDFLVVTLGLGRLEDIPHQILDPTFLRLLPLRKVIAFVRLRDKKVLHMVRIAQFPEGSLTDFA